MNTGLKHIENTQSYKIPLVKEFSVKNQMNVNGTLIGIR